MDTIKFRKLKAEEIDVRISGMNKGGVTLLLFKDARVDQNILDEALGIFGWQRKHELIGDRLYCTVSVRNPETGEWVSKQDVGTESFADKEKGQASDAFKRACFNLGIGRELYTCQDLFFPKDKLTSYKEEDGKISCWDKFRVTDITYTESAISSITIEASYRGKVSASIVFTGKNKVTQFTPPTQTPAAPKASETPKSHQGIRYEEIKFVSEQTSETLEVPEIPEALDNLEAQKTEQVQINVSLPSTPVVNDDTIVRIGGCRGGKYGDVKESAKFDSFLRWMRTATTNYKTEEETQQAIFFKKLAIEKYGEVTKKADAQKGA